MNAIERAPMGKSIAVMFGLSGIGWLAIIAAAHMLMGCGGAPFTEAQADPMGTAGDDAATHPVTSVSTVHNEAGTSTIKAPTHDAGVMAAETAAPEDSGIEAALSNNDAEVLPETGASLSPEAAAIANEAQCCQQCQNLAYSCQVSNCGGSSCTACTAGYYTCSQTHCLGSCP